MRAARRLALVIAVSATNCSWCSGPKPTVENDPSDLDAAPREEAQIHARCGDAPVAHIALPRAGDALFELGRARTFGARVGIGARLGGREGLLEVDALTARFTDTSSVPRIGDVPPPIPIVTADRAIAVAYEGVGKNRHLVARDAASPQTPIFSLDPEPVDESLAYDAIMLSDGAIAIAWDAPPKDETENGSAIWARVFRNDKLGEVVRVSPKDVDGDTPRLVAFGPTLVAFWIAHRALPRDRDAAVELEGPGQDLDRAWVEMIGLDANALAPTSPLRRVTSDQGRVSAFDVAVDTSNAQFGALPAMNLIARDGIELEPGHGGSALYVRVQGPDPSPPIVMTNRVGRGLPLLLSSGLLLFNDANEVSRSANDAGTALENFSGERALAPLTDTDILFAKDRAKDLDVFRCKP